MMSPLNRPIIRFLSSLPPAARVEPCLAYHLRKLRLGELLDSMQSHIPTGSYSREGTGMIALISMPYIRDCDMPFLRLLPEGKGMDHELLYARYDRKIRSP